MVIKYLKHNKQFLLDSIQISSFKDWGQGSFVKSLVTYKNASHILENKNTKIYLVSKKLYNIFNKYNELCVPSSESK